MENQMTQLPHKITHCCSSVLLSAQHVNSIWLTGHPISSSVILWPIQTTCPVVILLQQTKKGNFSPKSPKIFDLRIWKPPPHYGLITAGMMAYVSLRLWRSRIPKIMRMFERIFGTIKVIYHPTRHPTCQTHHPLAGGFNAISGDWITTQLDKNKQHILFNHVLQSSSTNKKRDTSWWLQPLWKIWSSNWTISPGIGVKINNLWVATT